MLRDAASLAVAALLAAGLAGCAESVAATPVPAGSPAGPAASASPAATRPVPTATSVPLPAAADPDPRSVARARIAPATPTPTAQPRPKPTITSDGRARKALLTIPEIGIRRLPVVPYEGRTDDSPGTGIQNGGVAASPYGGRGGVGPGGVGNYQVTAHRLSSTRAFNRLPELDNGDRVYVDVGPTRYVYEIRKTRQTSFRSASSLEKQRAAVPGRPGAKPTKAYLTLSTCATPEDHAAGNHWADENGNPEHRIDKIGVLISSGPRQ